MDLPILSFFFLFFFLTFSNKLADDQAFYFFSFRFVLCSFEPPQTIFMSSSMVKEGKRIK